METPEVFSAEAMAGQGEVSQEPAETGLMRPAQVAAVAAVDGASWGAEMGALETTAGVVAAEPTVVATEGMAVSVVVAERDGRGFWAGRPEAMEDSAEAVGLVQTAASAAVMRVTAGPSAGAQATRTEAAALAWEEPSSATVETSPSRTARLLATIRSAAEQPIPTTM